MNEPSRAFREDSEPTNRWRHSSISIIVVFVALAIFLVLLPKTLLMIFGGLLLALLLRSCGVRAAKFCSISPTWGVAICLAILILLLLAAGLAVAPAISDQIDELWHQLPQAVEGLKSKAERYTWGRQALDRIGEIDPWSSASGTAATGAVSSAFDTIGNAVLLLFIALYGAFDPGTYRRGFLKLFAPSIRDRAEEVLSRSVGTLQSWLSAKLISMAVVGVLTWLGLWLVGIPLAVVLGIIAGLLAFIPNVGPVLAALPGLLLAVPDGLSSVLLVLAVYLVVQTLESYLITPIVQKQAVSLPPVLVISSQLVFGALFGLVGLALATPLIALMMQLVDDLYVADYLERETVEHVAGS